jgi:nucleotide-binding universal stress UspA family protein
MLERILVPLDTSETSKSVVPFTTFLATHLHQPVHLVTVIPDTMGFHGIGPRHQDPKKASAAQQNLDAVRTQLTDHGITTTSEVSAGHVAERILAVAESFGAGLIAMATHGRVGPERWFVGSVADQIVRGSSTPVLLMRPGADGDAAHSSVDHVILPLDGSHLAEVGLPYATFLAQSLHVPMTLVRTVDPTALMSGSDSLGDGPSPELYDLLESDAKEYLDGVASSMKNSGIETYQASGLRPPVGEIIDRAHSTGHALVVMSTHGRSGLGRTVLGSVTDRVIRSSEAPVLVVRPGADMVDEGDGQ